MHKKSHHSKLTKVLWFLFVIYEYPNPLFKQYSIIIKIHVKGTTSHNSLKVKFQSANSC